MLACPNREHRNERRESKGVRHPRSAPERGRIEIRWGSWYRAIPNTPAVRYVAHVQKMPRTAYRWPTPEAGAQLDALHSRCGLTMFMQSSRFRPRAPSHTVDASTTGDVPWAAPCIRQPLTRLPLVSWPRRNSSKHFGSTWERPAFWRTQPRTTPILNRLLLGGSRAVGRG
jgi:hypothetical protein